MARAHGATQAPISPGNSNSDRRFFDLIEREARHLLGVREEWWPASQPAQVAFPELLEAGRVVLGWFHQQLADRRDDGFADDRRSALELMHWRDMALGVLEESGFQRRIWLEAAADQTPRSICVGGREVVDGTAPREYRYSATQGCFRVFEEERNPSGKKWPDLCPKCRRLQPERKARRAMKRYVAANSD